MSDDTPRKFEPCLYCGKAECNWTCDQANGQPAAPPAEAAPAPTLTDAQCHAIATPIERQRIGHVAFMHALIRAGFSAAIADPMSHAWKSGYAQAKEEERAPEAAPAQENYKPVAWAMPSLLDCMSAVEKNHATQRAHRKRGGEWEVLARTAERYSMPLYTGDTIAQLRAQLAARDAEIADLQHDVSRLHNITTELATENARLERKEAAR